MAIAGNDISSIQSELSKRLSQEVLDEEINKKISSFNGLLTREIAMKMIARENGIYADVRASTEVRNSVLTATVIRIFPEENYRTGKKSRAMEIRNSDAGEKTQTQILRLWNDDVNLFTKLRIGDEIAVQGHYEKNGFLNLGYSGKISISKAALSKSIADIKNNNSGGTISVVSVRGKVVSVASDSFEISDGADSVIIFGNGNPHGVSVGDEAIIENARFESGNLHLSENSRVLVKKTNIKPKPEITSASEMPGETRESELKSLGVTVAEDISLETIVNLKKSSIY